MRRSRIKLNTILVLMLIVLISCKSKEDLVIKDSHENHINESISGNLNEVVNQSALSIVISLKSLSQDEYNEWVIPSYEGYYDPDGQPLQLPAIDNFDYPYVEGLEDKELLNKVNETIKTAIFNEEFFSGPMSAVGVETTPWSEFEFPGIISNKDILSIPIVLYWNLQKDNYKSISVTIDMNTGDRMFLEDIIELNEEITYKMLYDEKFFINIDIGGTKMKEYLYPYGKIDDVSPSEASRSLLEIIREFEPEEKKPEIELYYLTKDGIVLTHFADGVPLEINLPFKKLKNFMKIKSWKLNDSFQILQ